jgi:uncharacterized repeat protein (TIGR03803 family)
MNRWGLSLTAAGALLAGCGGSQLPLSASPHGFTQQQSPARQAYHILHPFGRLVGDGTNPAADLIDVRGTLYGTTVVGGNPCNCGTVFSITTSGKERVLYGFNAFGNSYDGYHPAAGLLDVNGTLYGTTRYGGKTNSAGTIFSVTLRGKEKVLHSFDYAGLGGSEPLAGLIDVNGTLYGTTSGNDDYYGYGNVFSITPGGKYKVLHRFENADGANPKAALLNLSGTLYGTTASGGVFGGGTVFSITTAGEEQVLHSFRGGDDGAVPSSALINVQGTLYGTTTEGGPSGDGTIFSITTRGIEKIVHTFSGSDGSQPVAALKNVKGVLYGTTRAGGSNNLGTVFRLTKSGRVTVVYSFAKGDGVNPAAGVIAVGGTLYGTTYGDGAHSLGNVYSLTP